MKRPSPSQAAEDLKMPLPRRSKRLSASGDQRFSDAENNRMSNRDLVAEAIAGLVARPSRVLLTVLGTVSASGALVATLGLSKTAGSQIVGRFSEVAATDVSVVPSARAGGPKGVVLPFDAEYRVKRLNGVAAAGTLAEVDVRGALVRSVPVNDPLGAPAVQLPMKAASAGAFRAVRGTLGQGRFFDAGHSRAWRPCRWCWGATPHGRSASRASTTSRRSSSATASTR